MRVVEIRKCFRAAKAGARLYGTSTEKKTPGNGVKTESNLEEGELYDDEDKKVSRKSSVYMIVFEKRETTYFEV